MCALIAATMLYIV